MKLMIPTVLAAATVLGACSGSGARYDPILDGTPTVAYKQDLAQCQTLARSQKQFEQETLGAAAMGAAAGGILGELDDEGDAIGGAIVGALAGGIASAANNAERREQIVVECLRGRGHRVVG